MNTKTTSQTIHDYDDTQTTARQFFEVMRK